MQDFQNLDVWHEAHGFALKVDVALREFPRGRAATLRSQLSRAADSMPANIVEGCGSATQREFARYLDIAIKSSSETQYHLISARDRQILSAETCQALIAEVIRIRKMLFGLRKKVLAADAASRRKRKSPRI